MVCHSHQGHSEQTWKESQRRKGKLTRPIKNETLESLDLCGKDYLFIKHGLMLGT